MRIVPSLLFVIVAGLFFASTIKAQQDIRINDDHAGALQENPSIAIDPTGTMIVAWSDRRASSSIPQIYTARSTDGGRTWSSDLRASSDEARPTGGMEMGPNVVAGPNGGVAINWADIRRPPAWSRVDICLARSTDGGMSFSGDPRINNDSAKSQHQPALAVGPDGTLYALWHVFPQYGEPAATPIMIARSTDFGNTFEPQRRVDYYDPAAAPETIGSCNCCRPWVFTDNTTNVYVVFRIDSANYRDIFLSRSSDRGITWSQAVRVSKGRWKLLACPSTGPTGTARNDTVFVVWMEKRGTDPTSVFLARSTDGGATFGPDVIVDRNANFPSVALDARGRVFVLWNEIGQKGNIYCAVSEDGGQTFGPKRQVNRAAPIERNTGSMCAAAPDGTIYGVWLDTRRDDGDIYCSNLTELMVSSSVKSDPAPHVEIAIRPNPAHIGGEVEIDLGDGVRSATIVDMLGATIRTLDPGLPRQRVTIAGSGIYFLVADYDSGRQIRPCLVVR